MRKPITCETLEGRLFLTTTPNDASYASEWGLSAINVPAAWDTTTGSAGTVVADIDTGLDYTHDDLYLNVWINQDEIPAAMKKVLKDTDGDGRITFYDLNASANRGKVTDVDKNGRIDAADILTRAKYGGWADGVDEGKNGYVDDLIGWDFADNDRNPLDGDGHGTHTAGTIGATGNNGTGVSGVDWHVSIMSVKIFDDQGNSASDRSIAAAIRYSADMGARVSNNSWGGGGYSTRIYNAIAYAGGLGQLFVVAAGNDSVNLDSRYYNDYPSEYALDNIISVGATTSNGSAAYYSNYGSTAVDVFAPGSNVLSTTPGDNYERMSGTSMAAPHVTGAAALMLAANRDLTAAQLKARIIAGADQSAALTGRSVSGGELNVANAIANTTGARYTGSTSGGSRVIYYPGRGRRFFVFEPGTPVAAPVEGAAGSGSSSGGGSSGGAGSGASSGSSSSGSGGAAATQKTVVGTFAVVPDAPHTLARSEGGARQVLDASAGSSALAAAPAAARDDSRSSAAVVVSPTGRGVFSERRVSPTSAGYEAAVVARFNVDGVTVSWTKVNEKGGAREAGPAAQVAVGVVPAMRMADIPSALDAGAYVAAGERGLLPILPFDGTGDGRAAPAMAAASPGGAVARLWAAMGTPARAAAALVAVTTAAVGGYAHSRRKLRTRAAAEAGQGGGDGAGPIEFPLR